ncbi:MAG: VOC family protein [Sphingomonadales bacterium]
MSRPTRLHVAIGVSDLAKSRAFYSNIFNREPTHEIVDQVDWILDDPPVNFSIFYNPERVIGPEHVGLDYPKEVLSGEKARLKPDDFTLLDPDGLRVEIFSTDGRD